MNNISFLRPSARLVATVREERRDRREARTARRTLERELATYETPSEINDLLDSLRGQEGSDVEQIRNIVLRNQLRHGLHRAS